VCVCACVYVSASSYLAALSSAALTFIGLKNVLECTGFTFCVEALLFPTRKLF